MMRITQLASILALAVTSTASAADDAEPRLRRPIDVVASCDGLWLYTANQKSGSVSVVDVSNRRVVSELDLGGQLADLAVGPDSSCLLVLDQQRDQLVVVEVRGPQLRIASRLDVPKSPVRLVVKADTKRCFIASLWSRALTVVEPVQPLQATDKTWRVARTVSLPFAPTTMCLVKEGSRLIVAGTYSGTLAVVETDTLKSIAVKRIPGHNIRGMVVSPDDQRLLITQQILNPIARSTRDDVHWGNMISNVICSFDLEGICDPRVDALDDRYLVQLGGPGSGAADPGSISLAPKGQLAVVLSGVNAVAVGGENALRCVAVGRRPIASVSSRDGQLYVANQFSDSLSIVDIDRGEQVDLISLGPQPESMDSSQLGEMLFFDARLSHDGWMSCHSCHTDGHSNEHLNDNLSDGSYGAPKRVLSLLGVGQTGPWSWSGNVETLEEQVRNSIEKTMRGKAPPEEQVKALVAFIKTLPFPPAKAMDPEHAAQVEQGQQLFRSLDCVRCHTPPQYTSAASYDVNLRDAVGNSKFNPPSLRGAGRRTSLLHDGRAQTLSDVLAQHEHQLHRELTGSELECLILFLNSI